MTFRKSCVGWKRAVQSKRRTSQLARIPVLFRNTKEIDMKRKRMTGVRIIIAQSGADGVEVLSASLDAVLAVTAAVVSAASEASSGSSVLVKLTRSCCRGGGGDGGWRRGGVFPTTEVQPWTTGGTSPRSHLQQARHGSHLLERHKKGSFCGLMATGTTASWPNCIFYYHWATRLNNEPTNLSEFIDEINHLEGITKPPLSQSNR